MPRTPLCLLAVLFAVLVTACAADDTNTAPPSLEGAWVVLTVDGLPVVLPGPAEAAGETLSLDFGADGKLSGYTGVNRLSGTWSLVGDALDLPPAATTKRAGPPVMMDQERQFLQALGRVANGHRHGAVLVLADGDGDELLRLRRADQR